jgi:phosphoribosylformylglycinamidine cyclo-ligase
MGIGMVVALKKSDADKGIKALEAIGEKGYIIGSVEKGELGVKLC